jgi:hypothetical protein
MYGEARTDALALFEPTAMSSRVIVAHWQIKAGKREELLSVLYQLVAEIKANEPGQPASSPGRCSRPWRRLPGL